MRIGDFVVDPLNDETMTPEARQDSSIVGKKEEKIERRKKRVKEGERGRERETDSKMTEYNAV